MKKRFKSSKSLLQIIGLITASVLMLLFYANLTAQEAEEKGAKSKSFNLALVKRAPIYPGCEQLEGQFEIRKCLTQSIAKHFENNFDATLLELIPTDAKQQFAAVFFNVLENGQIEAKYAHAPHHKLKSEVFRVAKELPAMTPGTIKGNNVIVGFSVIIMEKEGEMIVKVSS